MSWDERYPSARVVGYDPTWPARYADIASRLGRVLGAGWRLEHVGSTSVPGLPAKPVIDLAVRCPPGVLSAGLMVESISRQFIVAGWTAPEPLGDHAVAFLLDGRTRSGIAHLFTADQWPQAHVRLFAAWLREHEMDRQRYWELKDKLLRAGLWGTAYTEGKGAFVLGVVNRARAAQGFDPVATL